MSRERAFRVACASAAPCALSVALAGCGGDGVASPQAEPVSLVSPHPQPDVPSTVPLAASDCVAPERDWLRAPEVRWHLLPSQIPLAGSFRNGRLRLALSNDRWGVAGTIDRTDGTEGNFADVAVSLFAQTTPLSSRNLGGSDEWPQSDESFALVADATGFYLGGQFCQGLELGSQTLQGQGAQDAFVTFLSEALEPGWSFALGGPGPNERVTSLALAPDGALYAAGQLQPGALAEGRALDVEPLGSFFLARLERGQLVWIHTWAGFGDGPQLGALSDGSVVVGSPSTWEPFLSRFSSAGELEWQAKLRPALSVTGIAVDARDQITAVGIQRDGIDVSSIGGERYCDVPEFAAYALQLNADGVAVAGYYGMYSAGGLTRTLFGYLRAFDDGGRELGQLVTDADTTIADLGAAGGQLRLVLRPWAATAHAQVVDLTPSPLLR